MPKRPPKKHAKTHVPRPIARVRTARWLGMSDKGKNGPVTVRKLEEPRE